MGETKGEAESMGEVMAEPGLAMDGVRAAPGEAPP
jgi:hypothetical protein